MPTSWNRMKPKSYEQNPSSFFTPHIFLRVPELGIIS